MGQNEKQPDSILAVLAFQPEAHDSAAAFFQCLAANGPRVGGWTDKSGTGYTVDVVPKEGEPFTAEILDVEVDDHTGQYKLVLAEWNEDEGRGDRSKIRKLDLYGDVAHLLADHYGDGDYGAAEDALWDGAFGPIIDGIQASLNLEWAA